MCWCFAGFAVEAKLATPPQQINQKDVRNRDMRHNSGEDEGIGVRCKRAGGSN
jgi:hypothetical protein